MTTANKLRRSSLALGLVIGAVATIGSTAAVGSPAAVGSVPHSVSARISPTIVPFSVLTTTPSNNPTVSGNGRLVVYVAGPGLPDGRTTSVWLDDREENTQVELTVPKEGVRLGNSVNPVISADGCVVVVTTEMGYDLFRDDDHGSRWDVYRLVLPECGGRPNDWALVSTLINTEGLAQARGDVDPTQPAAVSGAGSVVAYVRPFESLSGFDESAHRPSSIDVADMSISTDDPFHTVKAPGLPTDVAGGDVVHVGQVAPALNGDGSTLVFASDATSSDAVPDWVAPAQGQKTSPTQVFAWDRNDPDPFTAVTMLSLGANGPANASATTPAVSADGRFVAFSSSATNLDPTADLSGCAGFCPAQVYVVDRDTDSASDDTITFDEPGAMSIQIVSAVRSADGAHAVPGNGASFLPNLSSDGHTIVFATQATNLMQVQTPGGGEATDGDLLIADVDSKVLRRAFESPAPAPGAHSHPHLSANGRVLVADSLVANQLQDVGATGIPQPFVGRQVVAATFEPTLSLAALDFGTIMVGIPSAEWEVNVVNDGPGSFVPAIIKSDNDAVFTVTGGSCMQHAPVRAGQRCSVSVIFTPNAAGPLAAKLTVAEEGFDARSVTTIMRGAGGEPALQAKPSSSDFASALVGQPSADKVLFEVRNVYFGPASLLPPRIAGANPKDFWISNNGCRAQVPVGEACQIEVSFKPSDAGRRTATISFTTSVGQYTSVLVSGEGYYEPKLYPSPSVKPGELLGMFGGGFPAKTAVVIGWSDGSGAITMAITDATGGFPATLQIPNGFRPGTHTLVAQVINGPRASASVEIERMPRRSVSSPTFPRP
jgi:WD40-like Beta Propeller Repeat